MIFAMPTQTHDGDGRNDATPDFAALQPAYGYVHRYAS